MPSFSASSSWVQPLRPSCALCARPECAEAALGEVGGQGFDAHARGRKTQKPTEQKVPAHPLLALAFLLGEFVLRPAAALKQKGERLKVGGDGIDVPHHGEEVEELTAAASTLAPQGLASASAYLVTQATQNGSFIA